MVDGPWNNKGTDSPWSKTAKDDNVKSFSRKPGGKKDGGNGGPGFKISLWLVVALVLGGWLLSGFYEVNTDEQGVILRFGKYVSTTTPGLHYHLPYPVEEVFTPKVTTSNLIEIGVASKEYQRARYQQKNREEMLSSRPEEAVMLTGDENIVNLSYNIKWNIKEAEKYLFKVRSPQLTVKDASEAAMREVIGQTPIVSALTSEKQVIGEKAKKILQDLLDEYDSGINVLSVELLDVVAPLQIIDAFDDVQNAITDKKRFENEAEAYRNDIIPKARGEAQKIVYDAEAYREQVMNLATGDISRYLALYNEYIQAREVVSKKMYLDAMEEIMSKTGKIIIDDKANSILPYLPIKPTSKGGKQ